MAKAGRGIHDPEDSCFEISQKNKNKKLEKLKVVIRTIEYHQTVKYMSREFLNIWEKIMA